MPGISLQANSAREPSCEGLWKEKDANAPHPRAAADAAAATAAAATAAAATAAAAAVEEVVEHPRSLRRVCRLQGAWHDRRARLPRRWGCTGCTGRL